MAPTLVNFNTENGTSMGASQAMNMPANIVSGNLLMAFVSYDGAATLTASGWTKLDGTNASSHSSAVFAKIAAGSDTLTVTGGSTQDYACCVVQIANHGVSDPSTDITKAAVATGSSASPNTGNINPGTLAERMWIAAFMADDDDNAATWWPSGYTAIAQVESAQSTSACMTGVAYKIAEASSDNPGAFTMSATEEWHAYGYAIPPAPDAEPLPKTETIVDDFDGTTLDTNVWAAEGNVTVNNAVYMRPDETYGTQIYTNDFYSLEDSYFYAEMVQLPVGTGGSQVFLGIYDPDWLAFTGFLYEEWINEVRVIVEDDFDNPAASIPVGSNTRYWQMREDSGTLYFEVSSNGTSWTTVYSRASLSVVSECRPFVGCGAWQPEPFATDFIIDGWNTAPPGSEEQKSLSGSIAPTGLAVKAVSKRLTGGIAPAGVVSSKSAAITRAGSIAPSGALSRVLSLARLLSGSITPTSTVGRAVSYARSYSGSITPTGASSKQANKLAEGDISLSGDISYLFQFARLLSGSITPSGAMAKAIGTAKHGAITPVSALTRATDKRLSSALQPSGATMKQQSKLLGGEIDFAGDVSTALVKLLLLEGAIDLASTIVKAAEAFKSGVISPASNIAKEITGRVFSGSVTPTGTRAKEIDKPTSGEMALDGAPQKDVSVSKSGEIEPGGDVSKGVVQSLAGSLDFAGMIAKDVSMVLDGIILLVKDIVTEYISGAETFFLELSSSITPTSAREKLSAILKASGLDMESDISVAASKSITGNVIPSSALARDISIHRAGIVEPSAALMKLAETVVEAMLDLAGEIANAVTKLIDGEVTPEGSMAKTASIQVSGEIDLSSLLDVVFVRLLSLSSNISMAGALIRDVAKTNASSLVGAGLLSKAVQRLSEGLLAPEGTPAALDVQKPLSGALIASGEVSRQAQLSRSGEMTPSGVVFDKRVSILRNSFIRPIGTPLKTVFKPLASSLTGFISNRLLQRFAGDADPYPLGVNFRERLNTSAYTVTERIMGAMFKEPERQSGTIDE